MKRLNLALVALVLAFALSGCDSIDEAKKLKAQIDYLWQQNRTLEQKLSSANDEIKRLRSQLDNAKKEIERTKTLQKRMLE